MYLRKEKRTEKRKMVVRKKSDQVGKKKRERQWDMDRILTCVVNDRKRTSSELAIKHGSESSHVTGTVAA